MRVHVFIIKNMMFENAVGKVSGFPKNPKLWNNTVSSLFFSGNPKFVRRIAEFGTVFTF